MSTKQKAKDDKKKKGKGKKEKPDPNRLTEVDRQFYELYIEDAKKKIAHVKQHMQSLHDNNAEVVETVRSLWEDKTDICADQSKELASRNEHIEILTENIKEMEIQLDFERNEYDLKIKDLEAKYTAMYNQLASEIKILNAKLNSLDDFYKNWFKLLTRFDDTQEELDIIEQEHKQTLLMLEEKRVMMRNEIRQKVKLKLLQTSEDFMRSSEIRNSGYTRRLIRENIALQKEIYQLVLSQLKMKQNYKEAKTRRISMITNMSVLNEEKKSLIIGSQHRIRLIRKLTFSYERLKCAFTDSNKYPAMYRQLMSKKLCARFMQKKLTKELRKRRQDIEVLKCDNTYFKGLLQKHDNEIVNMRGVFCSVKNALLTAVHAGPGGVPPAHDDRLDPNDPLITHLMHILSRLDREPPHTPSVASISRSGSSIYRPGYLGFLPSTDSLMEPFKIDLDDMEMIEKEFLLKEQASKIIPNERVGNKFAITDVEVGSTLVYSSDRGDMEYLIMEEEKAESEEHGSDDYGSSSSSSGPKTKTNSSVAFSEQESNDTIHERTQDHRSEPEPEPEPQKPLTQAQTGSFIVDVEEVEELEEVDEEQEGQEGQETYSEGVPHVDRDDGEEEEVMFFY